MYPLAGGSGYYYRRHCALSLLSSDRAGSERCMARRAGLCCWLNLNPDLTCLPKSPRKRTTKSETDLLLQHFVCDVLSAALLPLWDLRSQASPNARTKQQQPVICAFFISPLSILHITHLHTGHSPVWRFLPVNCSPVTDSD